VKKVLRSSNAERLYTYEFIEMKMTIITKRLYIAPKLFYNYVDIHCDLGIKVFQFQSYHDYCLPFISSASYRISFFNYWCYCVSIFL